MKKKLIGALTTLLSLTAALVFISVVFAAPTPPSKHQTVSKSSLVRIGDDKLSLVRTEIGTFTVTQPAIVCPVKTTKLVDTTVKFKNDADSATGGTYWAYDTITRRVQIWFVSTGQYCIEIKDTGTFFTRADVRSPGSLPVPNTPGQYQNGGLVDGTEVGTLVGGEVVNIAGTFHQNDTKNWPLSGNAYGGTMVDYKCVIQADGSLQSLPGSTPCPGRISWSDAYFSNGYSPAPVDTWGWSYIGVDHSTAPDAGKSAGRWNNFASGNSGDVLDVD